ncbi:MAG: hypothetical protein ACR2L5_03315 [Candidatus Actinomarinaceae bacterium]
MSVTNVTCEIGDKTIKFETGKLALQAPGACNASFPVSNLIVLSPILQVTLVTDIYPLF